MKTTVEVPKEKIEEIVRDHLRSSMSLYSSKSKAETVWASDGSVSMTVTFEEESFDEPN